MLIIIITAGRFYKLQLISVDSRHFTQSDLSLGWSDVHKIKLCGHALAPLVIGKDHGQFLIESALHSFDDV